MAAITAPDPAGRRERGKQDKRDRIFAAAQVLFAERGFEGVTTQQVSDRADVAAGTLFRYAATKAELFLMVYNEQLREAIAAGAAAAEHADGPVAAVCALVEPVLAGARDSRSAAVYQRELLFGPPDEQFRAEGLALVADLERRTADRLTAATAPDARGPQTAQAAARAARTVFAILNLLLVQPQTGVHPEMDAVGELRAQVAQVVAGYLDLTR